MRRYNETFLEEWISYKFTDTPEKGHMGIIYKSDRKKMVFSESGEYTCIGHRTILVPVIGSNAGCALL